MLLELWDVVIQTEQSVHNQPNLDTGQATNQIPNITVRATGDQLTLASVERPVSAVAGDTGEQTAGSSSRDQ